MPENALFNVAAKAFIVKDGKLLMLRETNGIYWEVPGGRIQTDELTSPLHNIVLREVAEELGNDIKIEVKQLVTQWIRINKTTPPIFLNGFLCKYINGDITLSEEHEEFAWVTKKETFERPLPSGYQEALITFWKFFNTLH